GEEASKTLRRACRAADHGSGQGRGRAGALRARARLSRRADQRPRPRPLYGRQILLADFRARRGAQRADLHASDAAAAGGGRGAIFRALINGHVRGRYMDDKFFWPIFERAEALNVPIYMHPTRPPQAVVEAQYSEL